MAFIRIRGIVGQVYVPDQVGPRKHNCKDCFFCQSCSDSRCNSCRNEKRKLAQNTSSKKNKKSKAPKRKTA